jgi:G3E family GTPase
MTETYTPPEPESMIKVSLLTGFLGSGKTTLLNALVKRPDMGETAVLINEFGEIGLDHQLIEKVDEDTILLSSGCLCCTVRDDLSRALHELFLKRVKGDVPPFERVLIETTGLADPAPVIHTLMTDRVIVNRYTLDAIVTTVDAVNGDLQLDQYPESVKQAAVADRVLITKCDLAKPDAVAALERGLRNLNPGAPIFRVEHGRIEPEKLFDAGLYNPKTKSIDVQRWLRDEEILAHEEGHESHGDGHGHHHQHDHDSADARGQDPHDVNRHDARIRAYCVTQDEPLDWQAFVAWIRTLIALHGDDLLRVKGVVNIAGQDGPIAVHGVQHLFHDPVYLPEWPDADRRSRIVFIARDLERAEVEKRLEELKKAVAAKKG